MNYSDFIYFLQNVFWYFDIFFTKFIFGIFFYAAIFFGFFSQMPLYREKKTIAVGSWFFNIQKKHPVQ